MDYVTIGSTGITVNKNGFGALPIQRISDSDAAFLLLKAYHNGITFYDTARDYSDSESKIGAALSGVREKTILATKTSARNASDFWKDLETSLRTLKTDYIDIYQFHNPPFCPKQGDDSGIYDAMTEAKAQGKVRHIGITNHKLHIAMEAAKSGLYEAIQYPVSYLSTSEELGLVELCADRDVAVIAMKALAGGLITDTAAAYAFLMQYDNVIPIWGIQLESELDKFIACQNATPELDDRARTVIDRDIAELSGDHCRGCGYCMPCPEGITISFAARMSLLLKRSPESFYNNETGQESMKLAPNCKYCGHCKEHCPYGLDVPRLIQESLADYQKCMSNG